MRQQLESVLKRAASDLGYDPEGKETWIRHNSSLPEMKEGIERKLKWMQNNWRNSNNPDIIHFNMELQHWLEMYEISTKL